VKLAKNETDPQNLPGVQHYFSEKMPGTESVKIWTTFCSMQRGSSLLPWFFILVCWDSPYLGRLH